MQKLKPDYFFAHYREITPQWLKKHNIKTILSDLDGTLAPHNKMDDGAFQKWLEELMYHEISLIVVSNNDEERVNKFTDFHQIVGYAHCRKPMTKVIEKNLFQKGLKPETTMFLGDQLFTDIWCGKNLGIMTVLVSPIPGEDPAGIRMKRKIEKLFLNYWGKET